MNRRGFLKLLGVGAVAVVAAPHIGSLLETIGPSPEFTEAVACDASYVSLTTMSGILKELYADKIQDLIYTDNPFLKLVKHGDNWQGAPIIPVPLERS